MSIVIGRWLLGRCIVIWVQTQINPHVLIQPDWISLRNQSWFAWRRTILHLLTPPLRLLSSPVYVFHYVLLQIHQFRRFHMHAVFHAPLRAGDVAESRVNRRRRQCALSLFRLPFKNFRPHAPCVDGECGLNGCSVTMLSRINPKLTPLCRLPGFCTVSPVQGMPRHNGRLSSWARRERRFRWCAHSQARGFCWHRGW